MQQKHDEPIMTFTAANQTLPNTLKQSRTSPQRLPERYLSRGDTVPLIGQGNQETRRYIDA